MKEEKTFKEQIEILRNRKLQPLPQNLSEDEEKIELFLKNNNYYRVTGYLYKYKIDGCEDFSEEICLDKLLQIYSFDESLRSLISKILGVIEVSFRTYIAYTLAISYGPLGYLDKNNFFDEDRHSKTMDIIKGIVNQRKNKKRIQHNIDINGEDLPIWVLIDILSFTNLYHIFDNMKKDDKKKISKDFLRNYISPQIIGKWLSAFSKLRNDCAHHERIYYEDLTNIDIKTPVVKSDLKNQNDNLFAYLLCACHLIYKEDIWLDFLIKLEEEINAYPLIDISKIGFPKDWLSILKEEF